MTRIRQHHDADAEASVLGGIFLRPALLGKLSDLEVEDFAVGKHQAVWSAMVNLASAAKAIDPVTVASELVRMGRHNLFAEAMGDGENGAMAFCGALSLRVPSVENVMQYAKTIQEHRGDREALAAIDEIRATLNDADRGDMRGDEFVQWARARLGSLKLRGSTDTSVPIARIVKDRFADYEKIQAARERGVPLMLGLPTGIAALDAQIGGYPIGIGTGVAGRPGSGKSSVLRVAADACSRANIGAHTFSLEDLRARFADRVIGAESGVSIETLRTAGDLNRQELHQLSGAAGRLFQRQKWLIDDGMMTAGQIVARWRRRGEDNETKLVAVDYLGRIRKSDPRMTDFEHYVEASKTLCDAAKEDQVALLLGLQLNRECEKREDKRPQLADIRGAGPIEEVLKCVVGVYRGFMYGDPVEGVDWSRDWRGELDHEPDGPEWASRMELLMLKHNDGAAPGRVFAKWDGPTTTVS